MVLACQSDPLSLTCYYSLSRYSIIYIMMKFIHNQGHIKIIIINDPQYDPPWLRHSVPSITIFIYFIYHNDFLCMTAGMTPYTYMWTTQPSRHMAGKHERTRHLLVSLMRLSYIKKIHRDFSPPFLGIFTILFFDPNAQHHTTHALSAYSFRLDGTRGLFGLLLQFLIHLLVYDFIRHKNTNWDWFIHNYR